MRVSANDQRYGWCSKEYTKYLGNVLEINFMGFFLSIFFHELLAEMNKILCFMIGLYYDGHNNKKQEDILH